MNQSFQKLGRKKSSIVSIQCSIWLLCKRKEDRNLPKKKKHLPFYDKSFKFSFFLYFLTLSQRPNSAKWWIERKKKDWNLKITRWAFWGDEDLREMTRDSQESTKLLRAEVSSESSALLIREFGTWSNFATRGLEMGLSSLLLQNKRCITKNWGIDAKVKPLWEEIDKTLRIVAIVFLFFCSFFLCCGWVLRLRSGNGKGVFGRRDMWRKMTSFLVWKKLEIL